MAYQAVQCYIILPNKVQTRIALQGIDSEVDFNTVQVNIEKRGGDWNITVHYRTVQLSTVQNYMTALFRRVKKTNRAMPPYYEEIRRK